MAKLPALVAVALCLGIGGSWGQDVSTEAACIAALKKSAERLVAIENRLSSATRACVADQNAATIAEIERLQRDNTRLVEEVRSKQGEATEQRQRADRLASEADAAKRALANERKQTEEDTQRIRNELAAERDRADKNEQRIPRLQTENSQLARENAELRDRLSRALEAVNTAVVTRLRDLFSGTYASCETRPDLTVADGVVSIHGRLLRADDMKQRISQVVSAVPGATVRTDELLRIDVCGRPLGDDLVVATGESGLRRLTYGEVTRDIVPKLIEGTSENCAAIGAKLEQLRDEGAGRNAGIWFRRPGGDGAVSHCAKSSGQWTVSDTGLNLKSGLLVQRAQ